MKIKKGIVAPTVIMTSTDANIVLPNGTMKAIKDEIVMPLIFHVVWGLDVLYTYTNHPQIIYLEASYPWTCVDEHD